MIMNVRLQMLVIVYCIGMYAIKAQVLFGNIPINIFALSSNFLLMVPTTRRTDGGKKWRREIFSPNTMVRKIFWGKLFSPTFLCSRR